MQFLTLISALVLAFLLAPLAGLASAMAQRDFQTAESFLLIVLIFGILAGLGLLSSLRQSFVITRHNLFIAAILLWLALVGAGMPAFMLIENQSLWLAFYETSSAATTLGHSIYVPGEISQPMMIYRATLAWIGGLLTLILAVYVLGRYSVGGTPQRDLRMVMRAAERGNDDISRTVFFIATPYIGLTVLGTLALMLARVNPFLALIGAMNAVSTNGLRAVASPSTLYGNVLAESIFMVLMILGAGSILVFAAISARKFRQLQDHQDTYYPALVAIFTFALLGGLLMAFQGQGSAQAWSFSKLFDIVSSITTTSIALDARSGFDLPIQLIIILALMGGAAFSTSGGLKQFRILMMFEHAANDIRRLVYPSRIMSKSHEVDPLRADQLKAVWSTFLVTLFAIVALVLFLAIDGYALGTSLCLAVGALTNSGGLVAQNLFETFDGAASGYTLIVLGFAGIVGRLEILVILAALTTRR